MQLPHAIHFSPCADCKFCVSTPAACRTCPGMSGLVMVTAEAQRPQRTRRPKTVIPNAASRGGGIALGASPSPLFPLPRWGRGRKRRGKAKPIPRKESFAGMPRNDMLPAFVHSSTFASWISVGRGLRTPPFILHAAASIDSAPPKKEWQGRVFVRPPPPKERPLYGQQISGEQQMPNGL